MSHDHDPALSVVSERTSDQALSAQGLPLAELSSVLPAFRPGGEGHRLELNSTGLARAQADLARHESVAAYERCDGMFGQHIGAKPLFRQAGSRICRLPGGHAQPR